MGKVTVLVLLILLAWPLTILLIIGAVWVDNDVIGPWEHRRNTERAEAVNQALWETDNARIYSLRLEVDLAGRRVSRNIDIVCARKIETRRGSLKIDRGARDAVISFAPRYEILPVSDEFDALFDVYLFSCSDLKQGGKPAYAGFPALLRKTEPSAGCRMSYDSPTGTERIPFPEVVSARKVPIREVLDRLTYGPADRDLIPGDPEAPRVKGPSFYWNRAEMCWKSDFTGSEDPCPAADQLLCPR